MVLVSAALEVVNPEVMVDMEVAPEVVADMVVDPGVVEDMESVVEMPIQQF